MKILVAVDGSESSKAAVRSVAARPWPPGSEVRLVTAIHAPTIPDPFLIGVMVYEELMEKQREKAPELLDNMAQLLEEAGSDLAVSTKVLSGSPKEKIVQEAEQWGADLIVLGSHGQGMLRRFVLGSVAHAVAINAPCSVEIVRSRPAPAAS